MGNPYYLFRFPKGTPRFDYASLAAYMRPDAWYPDAYGFHYWKVGNTIALYRLQADDPIEVRLYDFPIAVITPDTVAFLPVGDDGHRATTEWLAAIARHNGIASVLWRRRRRKSDGPGPMTSRGMAGVLVAHDTADPGEHTLPGTYEVRLDRRDKTLTWVERENEEAIAYG